MRIFRLVWKFEGKWVQFGAQNLTSYSVFGVYVYSNSIVITHVFTWEKVNWNSSLCEFSSLFQTGLNLRPACHPHVNRSFSDRDELNAREGWRIVCSECSTHILRNTMADLRLPKKISEKWEKNTFLTEEQKLLKSLSARSKQASCFNMFKKYLRYGFFLALYILCNYVFNNLILF